MTESAEVQLARLEEQTKSLREMLGTLVEEMKSAAQGRRGIYEKLENAERGMIHIGHRLDKLEASVESIRPTTAELERVRDRVVVAGRLGIGLWTVGKTLLAVAAGAVAYWWIFVDWISTSGRPPP